MIFLSSNFLSKNPDLWDSRGKDLLSLIYGDSLDTEINFLNNACSDQWHWIEQSYARILSDTTYLDSKHTELNIIVSLIQMNTPRQVFHISLTLNVYVFF